MSNVAAYTHDRPLVSTRRLNPSLRRECDCGEHSHGRHHCEACVAGEHDHAFASSHAAPRGVELSERFEPLQVFFSFQIARADGTPLSTAGGGTIDFRRKPPGYVELRPGESHSIDADLAGLLSEALAPEDYSISATNHNQYGERCFHGTLGRNPITINVRFEDEERGP